MNSIELKRFLEEPSVRIVAQRIISVNRKSIDAQNASDYDAFEALCDRLYLLAGHPIRNRFLQLLSTASACDISIDMLYDGEYRKALWQRIFIDNNIVLPNIKSEADKKIPLEGLTLEKAFFVNSEIDISKENTYVLLDGMLAKIKKSGTTEIYFDARNISFIRPDDFHAQKMLESLKKGENDSSLLELWLLCRILMNIDVPLILRVDDFKKADDILSLIFRLGLLPKIIISIDISSDVDYDNLYAFLSLHHKKNISLEITCSKENKEDILNFLNIVPLVFVKRISIAPDLLEKAIFSILSKEETVLFNSYLRKVK